MGLTEIRKPNDGTRHNALYDAQLAGLIYFDLKRLEKKSIKLKVGFPRVTFIEMPKSAEGSRPKCDKTSRSVQPFLPGMLVWYRDACDEIVAATIMDVLPPSASCRYDIQTDAGERIDTNNIRQWSEVPPTVETWASTL